MKCDVLIEDIKLYINSMMVLLNNLSLSTPEIVQY